MNTAELEGSDSIVAGLLRGLSCPSGLPLHGPQGFFPSSKAGKADAAKVVAAGWLEPRPATPAGNGKRATAKYALTAEGIRLVEAAVCPKQALEQLVAAVEVCQREMGAATTLLQTCNDEMRWIRERVQSLLPAVAGERVAVELPPRIRSQPRFQADPAPAKHSVRQGSELLRLLRRWQDEHPHADCPLPELHAGLCRIVNDLTIGGFHDLVRQAAQAGDIRLQPWTGPLSELPQPSLALLAGHAVMYYAALVETETTAAAHGDSPHASACMPVMEGEPCSP